MRVLIQSDWPHLQVKLYDFETGKSALRHDHITWLQNRLLPILKLCPVDIKLVGGASRSGAPEYDPRGDRFAQLGGNRGLSARRAQEVEAHLRALPGVVGLHFEPSVPAGEYAPSGPGPNRDEDRAVAIGVGLHARFEPRVRAETRIGGKMRRFVQDLEARGWPGAGSTGEDREFHGGPALSHIQGYGFVMAEYLRSGTRPGPFVDRLTLQPRPVHFPRGEGGTGDPRRLRPREFRVGEDEAFQVWHGLTPEERWNVRSDANPEAAPRTLSVLCALFRKVWRKYAGEREQWTPGICEFYSARDETTLPLPAVP
jgi:hypothetical protein